ncbi:hypothetical protein T4C_11109 [Trichinella pseudospiralis]|uniref:Uncharacterized protein n=1 Tax=Trichinella pseudospiralis TaxID=6337 RepID=A0A0V1GIM4_TRIPS|nr:hypothetical protein T4C_11109 [Trichinella pseudospiralis]
MTIGNSKLHGSERSLAEEDIVDTRFTYGMLAKEHLEYQILISVECSMTDLI